MDEQTPPEPQQPESQQPEEHHPKHRRDDVPLDGRPGADPSADLDADLAEFGENPDTERAG